DQRIMARAGNAIYTSHNGGSSWNKAAVMNGSLGQLAYSANGAVLLHSPANSTTTWRSTNDGASWSAVTGLAVNNARPEADPVNPLKFYVYDSGAGRMMVSLDGGASFSAKGSLASGGATLMRALPGREGDLLVCLNGGGLVRSTDSGTTFSKLAAVSECGAVGFGKGAAGSSDPAIYLWGTVATERGVLRSTDMGATWVRVNDAAHQYGGPGNGKFVAGDMNTFGVVYMSSVGRGIAYGKPDAAGDVTVVPQVVKKTVNECTYVVTAAWNGGYNALVRITNKGNNVISGWTVNWTYTDNSSVQGYWNAAVSGASPNYSATNNQSWNHDIYPGGYAEFGMTVAGSVIPKVTGSVCE
ncbi:MAG: cellulose binding domain-containing protein, partial [Massilia sp.]